MKEMKAYEDMCLDDGYFSVSLSFRLKYTNIMDSCDSKCYSSLVAEYMTSLYRRDLTTTSGGNVSIKSADGRIWMTPTVSLHTAVHFYRELINVTSSQSKCVISRQQEKWLDPSSQPVSGRCISTCTHLKR